MTWARLMHKVYEVDPLQCPKCGAPMQVIALIDGADVIRLLGAARGATESACATEETARSRTDLPSRPRRCLSC
jgi:hypothetical protein